MGKLGHSYSCDGGGRDSCPKVQRAALAHLEPVLDLVEVHLQHQRRAAVARQGRGRGRRGRRPARRRGRRQRWGRRGRQVLHNQHSALGASLKPQIPLVPGSTNSRQRQPAAKAGAKAGRWGSRIMHEQSSALCQLLCRRKQRKLPEQRHCRCMAGHGIHGHLTWDATGRCAHRDLEGERQ